MNGEDDTILRSMPHAVGPEKSVLSVLMQYPEMHHDFPEITEAHFYLPDHAALFAELRKTSESGRDFELVGFVQGLLDSGTLEKCGGPGKITEIYTYQPSPGHALQHFGTLRQKLACRMTIRTANDMVMVAHSAPDDSELLDATSAPITAIHDALTGAKPALDAKALGAAWWENYQKLLRGEKMPMGIPTGIWEVDNALRGLHLGMLGVISAPTSGGKSTLATQIMCGVASKETPAIYLPLEGTIDAAYSRCIIQISRLPAAAITSPLEYAQLNGRTNISQIEKNSIAAALKRLTSGGFHFDPPANRRIQTIIATIRRARRKHGIKVAFVDYVQLIRGERGISKEQEIMGISNALQELAAELGIFIAVMSQENKEGDTKHARAIEEDSDWTISIVQHQDKKRDNYKQHRHILVTKDRHNGNGGMKLPLILDREAVRFVTGKESTAENAPHRNHEDF